MATPPPKCITLLVCDTVLEDKHTNTKSVLQIFNGVKAPKFPLQMYRLCIFTSLTDGRGMTKITARIVKDDDQTLIVSVDGTTHFKSPLDVTEFTVRLVGVTLPAPGPYSVQILAQNTLIGERRFLVAQAPSSAGGNQ